MTRATRETGSIPCQMGPRFACSAWRARSGCSGRAHAGGSRTTWVVGASVVGLRGEGRAASRHRSTSPLGSRPAKRHVLVASCAQQHAGASRGIGSTGPQQADVLVFFAHPMSCFKPTLVDGFLRRSRPSSPHGTFRMPASSPTALARYIPVPLPCGQGAILSDCQHHRGRQALRVSLAWASHRGWQRWYRAAGASRA